MRKFVRLNITSEGQTEERFVKNTLANYLGQFNIATDVRSVLTSKNKNKRYRGGLVRYSKAKNDIITWMKEDRNPDTYFTTMFDLYALPNDFPGIEEARKISDPYNKVRFLEEQFKLDIDDIRFIPNIQLHEFETLILSQPKELEIEYFEYKKEIEQLTSIVEEFKNPEMINDKPESAPSKRIINLIPPYEHNKVAIGSEVAGIIGIDSLKKKCQHFGEWITILEHL